MSTVLIFGGSGSIGSAICQKFAEYGYNIAFTYFNNRKEAEKLVAKLNAYCKTPSIAIFCDVCSESSIQQVMNLPIYFDIVVNCIGNALYKELLESSIEDFENIVTVNLRSTFLITKLSAQKMIARSLKGSIIHLSSIWGNVGASCESLYAATKGAINSFTKSIAKELAPANIRVNAVACGMIKSKMNQQFTTRDIQNFFKNAPIQKIGQPEDIATAVFFLAQNKYITGEILTVDAGVTLS